MRGGPSKTATSVGITVAVLSWLTRAAYNWRLHDRLRIKAENTSRRKRVLRCVPPLLWPQAVARAMRSVPPPPGTSLCPTASSPLGLRGRHRPPPARALCHIGIVAPGMVTIIPIVGRRLGDERRGRADHNGWVRVGPPVRPPIRPKRHHKAWPDQDTRAAKPMVMVSKAMPSVPMAPMPPVPVAATVGVPEVCPEQEQPHDHDEYAHPPPPCVHGIHPSQHPVYAP
jgi:hypothetical protein